MGTVVTFDLVPRGRDDRPALDEALGRACRALHRADEVFSLWRVESPMSRLRAGELALDRAPAEIAEVLQLCDSARERSGGYFDAGALPGGIDPTGLVKGWAVQRALEALVAVGPSAAMVNGGGDIATFGAPPGATRWRIGIQHPKERERLVAVVEVDGAIATSGTYERGAHLFDPLARRYHARFASATVTGPDLALADALATALCVAGPEGLEFVDGLAGYEGLGVLPDGRLFATPGLALAPLEERAGGGGAPDRAGD